MTWITNYTKRSVRLEEGVEETSRIKDSLKEKKRTAARKTRRLKE